MTMSRDATKRIMDAYLEALFSGGDFGQYFSPDVLWTTVETNETMSGRDTVRDFIIAFHTKTFDAHPQLVHLAVDDGVAAVEAVFVGTQMLEFGGVAATGAEVRVPYTVFYDVTEDGITALRAYSLTGGIVEQLRAPQTAGAAAGS
jgi:ketosteroid isomerase-like protein